MFIVDLNDFVSIPREFIEQQCSLMAIVIAGPAQLFAQRGQRRARIVLRGKTASDEALQNTHDVSPSWNVQNHNFVSPIQSCIGPFELNPLNHPAALQNQRQEQCQALLRFTPTVAARPLLPVKIIQRMEWQSGRTRYSVGESGLAATRWPSHKHTHSFPRHSSSMVRTFYGRLRLGAA